MEIRERCTHGLLIGKCDDCLLLELEDTIKKQGETISELQIKIGDDQQMIKMLVDAEGILTEENEKLKEESQGLKWIANSACCDLMRLDNGKGQAYHIELCQYDHIQSHRKNLKAVK